MTPKIPFGGAVTAPYPIQYVKGYQRIERFRILSEIKGFVACQFGSFDSY